jgi:hypothetical protein
MKLFLETRPYPYHSQLSLNTELSMQIFIEDWHFVVETFLLKLQMSNDQVYNKEQTAKTNFTSLLDIIKSSTKLFSNKLMRLFLSNMIPFSDNYQLWRLQTGLKTEVRTKPCVQVSLLMLVKRGECDPGGGVEEVDGRPNPQILVSNTTNGLSLRKYLCFLFSGLYKNMNWWSSMIIRRRKKFRFLNCLFDNVWLKHQLRHFLWHYKIWSFI